MIAAMFEDGTSLTRFDDGFIVVDPENEQIRRELQKPQEWARSEETADGIERRNEQVMPGEPDQVRAVILKLKGRVTIDDGDS